MQFNIVFHGMMVFVEQGSQCLILIPEIKDHDYRFGDPTAALQMKNLWPDDYTVTGIPARSAPDSFANHAYDYLVLKSSSTALMQQLKRGSIRLPMPDAIVPLRPITPNATRFSLAAGNDIFNGTPQGIAVAVPGILNDVIVFHYSNVDPSMVTVQRGDGSPLCQGLATLCLYAQTGDDDAALQAIATNQGDPPPSLGPHRTGVNDIVHYHYNGVSAHTSFELSRIGNAASAPASPGYGLVTRHLLNLQELKAGLTNGSGCVGCAIALV
jgi:hypothetical protein